MVDRGIEREVTFFFGARAGADLYGLDDIRALRERFTKTGVRSRTVSFLVRGLDRADRVGHRRNSLPIPTARTRRISVRAAAEIDAATELLIARGSPPAQHLL